MNTNLNSQRMLWIWFSVVLVLAALLLIVGLLWVNFNQSRPPATATPPNLVVSTPEEARDMALEYIEQQHPVGLLQPLPWSAPETLAGSSPGSRVLRYTYQDWQITVSYAPVELAERVYTVTASNPTLAFEWSGLVDAYGNRAEVRAGLGASPTPLPPTPLPSLTSSATLTPSATLTATPLPSSTPYPTLTPTSTASPTPIFSPTPTPLPCNAADFVYDVSIPDGAAIAPNAIFNKVWRLRNSGSCIWTTDYDLIHVSGDIVDGPYIVDLDRNVRPGETADLSVRLAAPGRSGDYRDFWMLRAPDGQVFGVGAGGEQAFWVSISVVESSGNYNYDFAINLCAAEWRSQAQSLRCDTRAEPEEGFTSFLIDPLLENRLENEPTLWLHPNENRSGWVEGFYPPYTVQADERFRAWAGCLEGYPDCNVTFYLAYQASDGRIFTLQEWPERYDGQVSVIDYDLSALQGQTVQFILGVRNNSDNFDDAQGFWFVPRLEHADVPPDLPGGG